MVDPPPADASPIPGLEVAGEVAALGEGCTKWQLGDRVCALVAGGGYAQYCIAHEDIALPSMNLTLMLYANRAQFCFWSPG